MNRNDAPQDGPPVSADQLGHDTTDRRRADDERQARLRFFEGMDRVNRAVQRADSLETMMGDVLDVVLELFACDRAFLLHPCVPDAVSWTCPMERTRPKYPGVNALGLEVQMSPEVADTFRVLLDADGPVQFGPGTIHPLLTDASERFGFKSFMSMALRPRIGEPWQFGVHQCSHVRQWDSEEERLFREIGWRLADGLSALLVQRSLRESEAKYRSIVDTAHEGIWVLNADSVTEFVNARMARLLGYDHREMLGRPLTAFMVEEDIPDHRLRMEHRRAGRCEVYERRLCRKDGQPLWAMVSATPLLDHEGRFKGSFAMLADVTERRLAAERLRKDAEREARLLSTFLRSRELSDKEMYGDVLDLAVELTDSKIGFLHRVSEDQRTIILTAWNDAALTDCTATYDTHYPVDRAGNWVDCVRIGGPVVYNDFATSPNRRGLPPGHAPVRRFMSVPVVDDGKVEIVFGVGNKDTDYDDTDLVQIQNIARELQKILRQRQATKRIDFLARLYRTISEINQLIVRERDSQRLLREACRIGVEQGGFAALWVGLIDLPGGMLRPVAAAGERTDLVEAETMESEASFGQLRPAARALLEGRVIVVDDMMADVAVDPGREAGRRRGFRSCAAFPIRADDTIYGVLSVYDDEPEVFKGEVEALLLGLVADLGYALHSLELDAQRRAAEVRLHESNELLRATIDAAPPGIIGLDLEGCVRWVWNRGAERLLGWSAEEAIGQPLPSVPTQSREEFRRFRETIRNGLTIDGVEVRRQRKNGEPIDYCIYGAPLRGAAGDVIGNIAVLVDLTQRKRVEAELRRLNRQLRTISNCNQLLLRSTDEQELLDEICRTVHDHAGYCAVWVGFLDSDRIIRLVAHATNAVELDDRPWSWDDVEPMHGPSEVTILNGTTVVIQDLAERPEFGSWRERPENRPCRAVIALPLKDEHGRTLGVLLIYSEERDAFTPQEITLLEELAGDLAFGVVVLRARANRREAERQIALLNFALSNVRESAFLTDEEAGFQYVNDEACRVLGYRREELLAMDVSGIDPDFPRARWPAHWRELKENGSLLFEGRHRAKDGRTIPVEVSANYFEYEGQGYNLALVRDITERRHTEEALRTSERRYRTAEAIGHVGNWEYDLETTQFWGSDEAKRIYGFDPERADFSTEEVESCIPERERVHQALVDLLEHAVPYDLEFEIHPRDGASPRTITSIARIQQDASGRPLAIVGVIQDITERKRLEVELRRQAAALDQTVEAIIITDPHGAIEYVNPAFTRVTGFSLNEALGANPRLLKSGQHEAPFYIELWQSLLRGAIWHGRIVNRRRDGKLIHVDVTISPVRDPNGSIVHFVAVERDITAEVVLEDQLRQAQKTEAIGRLAGGIAHDFNNLLVIILGHADMLLEQTHPADPRRNDLKDILHAAERAANLTRQLLAFSRRQVLKATVLDLGELVRSMARMLRRLLGEDIELSLVIHPHLGKIKADAGQLEQVVLNLVVNARDAMANGGRLHLEVESVELDEHAVAAHEGARPGAFVMLAVRDSGCGMTDETRQRVFEPFFTTKEHGKGTGLGLAIVYGVVRQSDGVLKVESAVGQGTTFRIYLPCVYDDQKESARPDDRRPLVGSETVLLVEDDAAVRRLAQQMLESSGYTVLVAASGEDALRLASAHDGSIDLLLTDVVMPGTNGAELARDLVARRPDAKVLFMSGYTEDAIVRRGLAGAVLLTKPFTKALLARKVREVLDDRRPTPLPDSVPGSFDGVLDTVQDR